MSHGNSFNKFIPDIELTEVEIELELERIDLSEETSDSINSILNEIDTLENDNNLSLAWGSRYIGNSIKNQNRIIFPKI